MLNTNPEPLLISAEFSQAIYYGALEMLGAFELRKLFKKTGNCDFKLSGHGCQGLSSLEFKDLLNALIEQYGLLTAQGIFLRIGCTTFQYLRRNSLEIIFNSSIEESMRPLDKRITNELENLTQWLQKNLTCQIGMEKENENWIIRMNLFEKCHPEINKISFYFFNGILRESLEWMDSRHRYRIKMLSNPIDDHSSYRISINYQPID